MAEHRNNGKCAHGYPTVAVRRPDLGEGWWHDVAENCPIMDPPCKQGGTPYKLPETDQQKADWLAAGVLRDEVNVLQNMVSAREGRIAALERELKCVKGESLQNAASWREACSELVTLRASILEKEVYGDRHQDDLLEEAEIVHETTHCLDRAIGLVCGPRAGDYGDPRVAFDALAQAWSAYLEAGSFPLDARDCSNMLIVYKTLRDRNSRKSDNMDDIAGYAQIGAWIGDPRED